MAGSSRRPDKSPEGEDEGFTTGRQGFFYANQEDPTITKFFVTKLPETCNSYDLKDVFKDYGRVTSSYVARKRDNEGNVFGFVSMKDVGDRKEMEKQLNHIKMGGKKVKVNIATFTRENPDTRNQSTKTQANQRQLPSYPPQNFQPLQMPDAGRFFLPEIGRTYVGALMNEMATEKTMEIELETDAFNLGHGKAAIATTINFTVLRTFHILVKDVGFNDLSIQYLGVCNLLIVFYTKEEATNFQIA
ncbi:putative RNA recognition motif domain, nucleotide-binding alpha-beta plait domain superfamily [Helianthus anomalus]